MNFEAALDDIYEAAVVPDRWLGVLDSIAGIAGAAGTILIASDTGNPRSLNSPSLDGFLEDFIAGDWSKVDSRTPKLLGAHHAGFLLEEDVYTPEEIASDAMIQGFLRPRGFGWATATHFSAPTGDELIFSVERRYADGPVPRASVAVLDRLRPHLGRSAMLSAKAGLTSARSTADTLGGFGLAAGVVAPNLRLVAVNDLLQPLIPSVVLDSRERVAFANAAADAMLVQALKCAIGLVPQSIPIAAQEKKAAIVAHIVPIRGAARDVFAQGAFILLLTPAVPSNGPSSALLEGLFDLTAAEARVVRGLAEGKKRDELAAEYRVSSETVRTQMKAAFRKTGVKRQIDLIRLVSGLSLSPVNALSQPAAPGAVAPPRRRSFLGGSRPLLRRS